MSTHSEPLAEFDTNSSSPSCSSTCQVPERSGVNEYVHKRLHGAHSIRILTLEYAEPESESLPGRLDEVSLLENPEYTALSYAWDAQTPSEPIFIGETRLLITPNCADALREFRMLPEGRKMWVDSICINQQSIEEKSQQVQMMWRIYRSASRVWIWVGLPDQETISILEHFNEAIKNASSHHDFVAQIRAFMQTKFDFKNALTFDLQLMPLFKRSWFRRMWVLQEVWPDQRQEPSTSSKEGDAESNREVTLFCGPMRISWPALLKCTTALYFDDTVTRWYSQAVGLFIPSSISSIYTETERHPSFVNLLVAVREKECTDPRDKIFYLYGILGHYGISITPPDYRKCVEDVFSEATATALEHSNDLNTILKQATRNRNNPHLPSWVPDWSIAAHERGRLLESEVEKLRFSPALASSTKFEVLKNGKQLTLYGHFEIIADRCSVGFASLEYLHAYNVFLDLSGCGRMAREGSFEMNTSLLMFAMMERNCQKFAEWLEFAANHVSGELSTPDSTAFKDAFISCLTRENPKWTQPADFYTAFNTWRDLVVKIVDIESSDDPAAAMPQTEREKLDNEYQKAQDILHLNLEDFIERTLIVTQNGRLGTVCESQNQSARRGDLVGHVMGMNEPIVLRPVGDTYTLVSTEAYVHGIMHGEIWPEDQSVLTGVDII